MLGGKQLRALFTTYCTSYYTTYCIRLRIILRIQPRKSAALVEWATVHYSERAIIVGCTAVLAGGFLALAAATSATHLYLVLVGALCYQCAA
eukprot:110035-Pyramimonas_sp.AAC.1